MLRLFAFLFLIMPLVAPSLVVLSSWFLASKLTRPDYVWNEKRSRKRSYGQPWLDFKIAVPAR